ncbi:F166A protein, partial [Melanocharis versteri]|nr:F166A protein [Melanocharis versteri]
GYTGFIPCAIDNIGMTYIPSVKKAMKEFDRYQLLQRNPPYTLGTRFPLTHWPDTKIYNRAGLKPAYTGFVPYLRDLYGLTYGNGTRESYRCEQRRRGRAL